MSEQESEAKHEQDANDAVFHALKTVTEKLEPLTSEQRARVLQATCILFDLPYPPRVIGAKRGR